jgi:hypothetical protein
MNSILEALFDGELSPAGMITPDTPEYHLYYEQRFQIPKGAD